MKRGILIVDDKPDLLHKLRDLLTAELPDVDISIASDFPAAMKAIQQRPYDVIITDIRDLEGDDEAGYELLRVSKRTNPWVQVIVYTGYGDVDLAFRCARAGCYKFIEKRVDSHGPLVAATREALKISSQVVDRDALSERLIRADWEALSTTSTPQKRGYALENLCSSLFGTIPGWQRVSSRIRTKTEEIDLVIVNESKEEYWRRHCTYILVECKYWTTRRKPGKNEFDAFYRKIERRGVQDCRLGFFVSVNGVTGTFRTELVRISKEPIKIVTLDVNDIWDMICSDNRSHYLKDRVTEHVLD